MSRVRKKKSCVIAACMAAQDSVKNDFPSKGKTLKFDYSTDSKPVCDQHLNIAEIYKCAKFHCNRLRNDAFT